MEKKKPFNQFELILVSHDSSPEVHISNEGLLHQSNLPHKNLNFTYGYFISKNLEIVKVLPSYLNTIRFDIFDVSESIKVYKREFLLEGADKPIKTLSKRFQRNRHKIAYKIIKECKNKESIFCCWEWSSPSVIDTPRPRDQGFELTVFASYSMFALVK